MNDSPRVRRDAERIGLIVPADSHLDDEMWALTVPRAIPFITRTRTSMRDPRQPMTVYGVERLAESPDLEDAADRLKAIAPAAAAYVDTSITFIRGPGGDTEIAQRIQRLTNCPTTVTSLAVGHALGALGVRRVAVVTPYPQIITDALHPFLGARGIAVTATAMTESNYVAGNTSKEMGELDPQELLRAVNEADSPDAEGIFIACTAVRTVDVIDPLEQRCGKAVVTAIQATMWHVQQLAGLPTQDVKCGRLFRDAHQPKTNGVPPEDPATPSEEIRR